MKTVKQTLLLVVLALGLTSCGSQIETVEGESSEVHAHFDHTMMAFNAGSEYRDISEFTNTLDVQALTNIPTERVFPDLTDTRGYSVRFEHTFSNGEVIEFTVMDGLIGEGDIILDRYETLIQDIVAHEQELQQFAELEETTQEITSQGAIVHTFCKVQVIWCWDYDGRTWPNGHFKIDYNSFYALSSNRQSKVLAAMADLQYNTGVRLYLVTSGDRVVIETNVDPDKCASFLGRAGGTQEMFMGQNCWNGSRTIRHEIGHALGLIHEHQRPDRDTYVNINYHNIKPGQTDQFDKKPASHIEYMTNFDYGSIMLYFSDAFSISPGSLNTIEDKQGNPVPYNTSYSFLDYATIRYYYP